MLHPHQFEVNEAWIAFRLNDAPVSTEQDGEFNCVALIDAASCFILSMELIPACAAEPTLMEFRELLKQARAHKQQLPQTLVVPSEDAATVISREAANLGVDVVRVPEGELLHIIGEARRGFAERFEQGPAL